MLRRQLIELLSHSKGFYLNLSIKKYGKFDLSKPVVLFGAAQLGAIFLGLCKKNKIKVIGIYDNDIQKKGRLLGNYEISLFEDLKRLDKQTQIIITSMHDETIHQQLKGIGFTKVWSHKILSSFYPQKFFNPYWKNSIELILANKKKIIKFYEQLSDQFSRKTLLQLLFYRLFLNKKYLTPIQRNSEHEYFDDEIFRAEKQEVFIDGGAYNGDTLEKFLKLTEIQFKSIYCFEPDKSSFSELKQKLLKLADSRIKAYPLGLGKRAKRVHFTNDGTLGSRINKNSNIQIQVIALDDFIKEAVTTIKLDIEGAETDALQGAQKIIRSQKPKLAICIYHRTVDLYSIPLMIKKLNGSYKLYLRHYSDELYDTVLYAI